MGNKQMNLKKKTERKKWGGCRILTSVLTFVFRENIAAFTSAQVRADLHVS